MGLIAMVFVQALCSDTVPEHEGLSLQQSLDPVEPKYPFGYVPSRRDRPDAVSSREK